MKPFKLITGTSHPKLGASLATSLDRKLVDCSIKKFSNTENCVQINESVRNENVCIIQTGGFNDGNSVNDYLMETLILIDACKRSNVNAITLIMPCYPYARQDKKDAPRVPISAKLVANLLETAGATRIVTMDLHASQIQGFFDIPCDNLYAIGLLSDYLSEKVFKGMSKDEIEKRYIFVAPDNGGAKRIDAYTENFDLNNIIMHKQRDHSAMNKVDKTILIGTHELQGKTAILIDDMMDTMGTALKACETLADNGIEKVIVMVTHGILSGPALERINGCQYIERVVVTNTLPQDENMKKCSKLDVVDIAPLLKKVVECIEKDGSISSLFH